ncbi:single-stranded DNA-binding protein [bacterium]|nr:single-stranded DNA-binding protein [bacterium]
MASLNKVMLIGNLTKDPELRYTPSGTAVADFRMAINREWTDKEGEKRSETCFVDIVAWRRQAEVCDQFLSKGSLLYVEGRLQLDTWETPQGERRSKHRVVAERVQFLGGKSAGAPRPAPTEEHRPETPTEGASPTESASPPEEGPAGMPF